MPQQITSPPRLLVSVRSLDEADLVLTAHVDILDVKEPLHGALGSPTPNLVQDIADRLPLCSEPPRLSVALGEAADLIRSEQRADAKTIVNIDGVHFGKLGPALLNRNPGHRWQHELLELESTLRANGPADFQWVRVAYADARACGAPQPVEVLQCCIEHGRQFLLIDTYQKDGRSLTDYMTSAELQQIVDQCRQANISLVLAGSVRQHHLSTLRALRPSCIGVRGAVCTRANRTATIDHDLLLEFQSELTRPLA